MAFDAAPFENRLVRSCERRRIGQIVVAAGADLARWFDEHGGLAVSVRVVAVETIPIGHWGMYYTTGRLTGHALVTVKTEHLRFHTKQVGLCREVRFVAFETLSTDDRFVGVRLGNRQTHLEMAGQAQVSCGGFQQRFAR